MLGSRTGFRFTRAPSWPGVLTSGPESKVLRAQCTGNAAKFNVAGNLGEHQEPRAPEFRSELSVNKRRAGAFPASGLRSDSTGEERGGGVWIREWGLSPLGTHNHGLVLTR